MSKKASSPKPIRILFYIVTFGYAAIALFPFIWSLYTSLRPTPEAYNFNINFSTLTFKAYETIIQNSAVINWYANSIIVAVVSTALGVLVNSMMGYALARIKFKGSNILFYVIIGIMMIPGQITMIPTYMLLNKLGFVNTYIGLIIPTIFNPFNTFLMRQFFISLPISLEEAAEIDGLSKIKTFFRIGLPLARPAVVCVTIMSLMGSWNNFLFPSLLATDRDMFTLPVGMSTLNSQYASFPNQTMAAAALVSIPMILMFLFFQRYFIEGIAASGSKE